MGQHWFRAVWVGKTGVRPLQDVQGSFLDQCVDWPSSLLLVAKSSEATKTTMITGTTKNGEVMLIAQAPVD
jgi:hypothetical protein